MFKGLCRHLSIFHTVASNLHINSSNYGVAAHTDIFNRYRKISLLSFLLLICNTILCICTNALVKFRHVSKILLHNQTLLLINTKTVFLKQYNDFAFSFCTKSTLCLNLLVVLKPIEFTWQTDIQNNYSIIQNNYAEYIITFCMICC